MSETLALVMVGEDIQLIDLVADLRRIGMVDVRSNLMLTIQSGGETCYLVSIADPDGEGLFDDWPEAEVPSGHSSSFSLDYRSRILAVEVVRGLFLKRRLLVDTNYGKIVSGADLTVDLLDDLATGYME